MKMSRMCLSAMLIVLIGSTSARVTGETTEPEESVTTLTTTTMSTTTTTPPDRDCAPYRYCDGETFPRRLEVNDRAVLCDMAPNIRERCCLPRTKHVVCYNIRVEGQFLSYDRSENIVSTDFTALCKAMASLEGHTTGKLGSASLATGEKGVVAYRYGKWWDLDEDAAGQEYLKDVACEILDEDSEEKEGDDGEDNDE